MYSVWSTVKELRELILAIAFSKFRVAVHLPHSTVERHNCGVGLKATTQ